MCATRTQRDEPHSTSGTTGTHHVPVALIRRADRRCRLPTGGTLCNGPRSQWPGKFAEDEMALPGLLHSYFSLPFFSRPSHSDAFARAVEIESRPRSRKKKKKKKNQADLFDFADGLLSPRIMPRYGDPFFIILAKSRDHKFKRSSFCSDVSSEE